jgi:hypothetical protein
MTINFANINDVWSTNKEGFANVTDDYIEKTHIDKKSLKKKFNNDVQDDYDNEYIDSKKSDIENRNIISNQLKDVLISYLNKIKLELTDEIKVDLKKQVEEDIKSEFRYNIDRKLKNVIKEYQKNEVNKINKNNNNNNNNLKELFTTNDFLNQFKNYILNNKILFICILSILLIIMIVGVLNHNNNMRILKKYIMMENKPELINLLNL